MRVQGTSEAADELRKELMDSIREMAGQTSSFVQKLNSLEASCKDDSYEVMRTAVFNVATKIDSFIPELKDVCERLREYSDFLNRDPFGSAAAGISTAAAANTISAGSGAAVSLAPTQSTPRQLEQTQFGFVPDGHGAMVYDSPVEMGRYLYSQQGSAYINYKGTCGLCSCANILRLAGVNLGEKEMIDYATSVHKGGLFSPKLCTSTLLSPLSNGGTSPEDRQQILKHFGIESSLVSVIDDNLTISDNTIEQIANYVQSGHGVILSVHANVLKGRPAGQDRHAITVTSVTRDTNGKVMGFHICDSNHGTIYYDAFRIRNALTGNAMNVTDKPIR